MIYIIIKTDRLKLNIQIFISNHTRAYKHVTYNKIKNRKSYNYEEKKKHVSYVQSVLRSPCNYRPQLPAL